MNAHEVLSYRIRLQKMVVRLAGDVARFESEALRPAGSETGERPVDMTAQEVDLPAHRAEEEVAHSLLGTESHILVDVNVTLARIEAGTFGRCEQCGRFIHSTRLKAVPYARHCLHCAELAEGSQ
jgi:RNA polymerase-binding transcription factor DksA